MVDIVDQATRSRMMSGIRDKNTNPEILVRRFLHRRGFRFRINDSRLPGKPDVVLPRYRATVFVQGCFWHGHGCHLFKWPKTREDFWREKILANIARDRRNIETLIKQRWRVALVWECAIKSSRSEKTEPVMLALCDWIKYEEGLSFWEAPDEEGLSV